LSSLILGGLKQYETFVCQWISTQY
jgi:hypothetical protein